MARKLDNIPGLTVAQGLANIKARIPNADLSTFRVVCEDVPGSLECLIRMGFANEHDPDNFNSYNAQELRVDKFTARTIMTKTKQELYDAFVEKDETIVIE